jgi:hypothetical protein
VLQAFGEHTEGESLSVRDRIIAGGSVGQDAWKVRHLCDPPAVALLIELNAEIHIGAPAEGREQYNAESRPLEA